MGGNTSNLAEMSGAKTGVEGAPKPDRRRAPETAARILDAAESLFSQRGFYGVSLRDIATEAGVQVALTHYHFGSKDDLFRAVIDRRADEHADGMTQALAQAVTRDGSRADCRRAIIRAFITPIVDRSMRGGAGWKNYIRLMALVANLPQGEAFVSPFRQHFDDLIAAYVHALHALHPEMDEGDVHWCFFFFQAMTTHILVESGMLDRQSGGRFSSSDLDAMVDRLVDFVAAGFTGLGADAD